MFKIKTSMFSTIYKIFHNHHFISTDCNYTIPNPHNQISNSPATSLQHPRSLSPSKKINFCYFILNATRNQFHWFLPIHVQYNLSTNP